VVEGAYYLGINAITVGLVRGNLQLQKVAQRSIITFAQFLPTRAKAREGGQAWWKGKIVSVSSPRDSTCVEVFGFFTKKGY
jgi:hypothetical protein